MLCPKVCSFGAIEKDGDKVKFDLDKCVLCGSCEEVCPVDAIKIERKAVDKGAIADHKDVWVFCETTEGRLRSVALELVTETGAKVHFGRLSSARGVEVIRRAKEDGLDITADVSAHQLYLTEMDISSYNSLNHVIPPLRSQRDREALRLGLTEGVIDAICSDHQPHEPDAKHGPYASTQPGMSTLETLLPLVLRLVEEQVVPLSTALSLLTDKPASILGSDAGILAPGRPADLCVIDTETEWQFDIRTMSSRGHNSPFVGWDLKGKARYTIVGGALVYAAE